MRERRHICKMKVELEIETLESRLEEMSRKLSEGSDSLSESIYADYGKVKEELEEKMEAWEELNSSLLEKEAN